MDNIKDWILDKIEDIKVYFKNWWWNWTSLFSLQWISDVIETKWSLIFVIALLAIAWWFYLFFWSYMTFKTSYINWLIQDENTRILNEAKNKKESEKELYQNVTEQIIERDWFNIWDLVCFFDNFDKRKIDYVNRWYKLQKISFDEENQEFDIVLQWLKNYNSLTDLLVLLKSYKTLIDLETYDIQLQREKVWIWEIDYYVVWLKWKILNS